MQSTVALPVVSSLRVVSRVMQPSTFALFGRLGLGNGYTCLDVGCGGGDVGLELARKTAPHGTVIRVDLDPISLELAEEEAREQSVTNVEYVVADACQVAWNAEFNLVYARFLLTHLSNPAGAIRSFYRYLRPGGTLVVEDIDFSGIRYSSCLSSISAICGPVLRRGPTPRERPEHRIVIANPIDRERFRPS